MRGRPIVFKCARCKRKSTWNADHTDWTADAGDTRPTGQSKDRDGVVLHGYRCLKCGHMGWSKHPSLAARATKLRPLDWDQVELAMARAKRGTATPEDLALCAEAHDRFPRTYRAKKEAVDREVHEEERRRWRS